MPIDSELLARQLWTIGDVNRLRLLALLPHAPDCASGANVTDLAEKLGLSQPSVSNHLARLRTLGLVRYQKICRDVYYWIDPEVAEEVCQQLRHALLHTAGPRRVPPPPPSPVAAEKQD